MSRGRLIAEWFALYVGAPLFLAFGFQRPPVLPALWIGAAISLTLLYRDPSFDRAPLRKFVLDRALWVPRVLRFALFAATIIVAIAAFAPDRLFEVVRQRPGLWALIMIGYPLASVVPQGLIYRVLHAHRYSALFGQASPWVSGVVFGLGHAVFRNEVAVALTIVGGVLFALTYLRSGSLWSSCLEHAAYGCFLFSVGLGSYLYSGAVGQH